MHVDDERASAARRARGRPRCRPWPIRCSWPVRPTPAPSHTRPRGAGRRTASSSRSCRRVPGCVDGKFATVDSRSRFTALDLEALPVCCHAVRHLHFLVRDDNDPRRSPATNASGRSPPRWLTSIIPAVAGLLPGCTGVPDSSQALSGRQANRRPQGTLSGGRSWALPPPGPRSTQAKRTAATRSEEWPGQVDPVGPCRSPERGRGQRAAPASMAAPESGLAHRPARAM